MWRGPHCWMILVVGIAAGCGLPEQTRPSSERASIANTPEVDGVTQPVPGRVAIIAPAVLHPVEEVLVQPGDPVKKGQTLVKIDKDEPEADVRAKKAAHDASQITLDEARSTLDRIRPNYLKGALSEQRYHVSKTALAKAEADERAAKAAVEAAEAELEHYTLVAPLDGIVSSLNVSPGTVSRPGTTVWGEILNLDELDVRITLPPPQADKLTIGQTVEVVSTGQNGVWPGRVTLLGIAADPVSGEIPVLVRVSNPQGRLRCHQRVKVRLGAGK